MEEVAAAPLAMVEEAPAEHAPLASLAPGVESLPEEADGGVPWEEQEDPYESRVLPGEEELVDDEAAELDEDEVPPPPAPAAQPQEEGLGSPWPRRENAEGTGERDRYWQRVLTGDPDTVPDEVRARAAADDAGESAEEREYRMLSTINRSWAADHSESSREELRAAWPQRRAELARRLGAADNERELFTALSQEQLDAPRREAGRAIYERAWRAGVLGHAPIEVGADGAKLVTADLPHARGLATHAYGQGQELRRRHLPLAQKLAAGLEAFAAMEEDMVPAFRALPAAPELVEAVDALASMEPQQRQLVYALAQEELRPQAERRAQEGLLRTAQRSLRRGAYNTGLGVGQLLGNMSANILGSLGRAVDGTLGTDIEGAGRAMDARARIFEEARRLYQGEVVSLEVGEEAGLAGQMLVDAAGAVPAAVMACCGGAGFASLWASGAGESVAGARQLAPGGDRELQLAAGMVGSSLQAGIYMGMGKLGGRMLENAIARFARAGGSGVKGYSLAALDTLKGMSAQSAALLAAGKLADASGKGAQELAARLDGTASNIDWQAYGDNLQDIELNMREAAMTLPFVLIGSGRVALRHFRSPRSVLGEGRALEDWGIGPETRKRIMEEKDIDRQGELLREALSGSRRWSAPGFIFEAMRALRLLHTDSYQGFKDPQVVADFLKLPPQGGLVPRPPLAAPAPKGAAEAKAGGPDARQGLGEALKLWDEWWQKAHVLRHVPGAGEGTPSRLEAAAQHRRFFHEDLLGSPPAVAERVRAAGLYAPQAEGERMALLRDRVAEATDLSYQFLLHAYSLDALTHHPKGVEALRGEAEQARKAMLGALARSVVKRALGQGGEAALGEFGQYMADCFAGRSSGSMAPDWLRRLSTPFLRDSAQRAFELARVADTGEPLEVQELYRVELGMLSCANALYELLPMTPDFQTALSRGMTPAQAYAHLLGREFELDLSRVDEFPHEALAATGNSTDMAVYSARNAQDFGRYSALTGAALESVVGDDGATYWRVRRPNGRPTHWHGEKSQAINDLVANTALTFMPFGLDAARMWQQRAAEPDFDLAAASEVGGPWTFTAFDQLCNTAVRELSQHWLEAGTGIMPGFGRAELRTYFYVGGKSSVGMMTQEEGARGRAPFLRVDAASMLTPLSMARARFFTFWWRQLCSGIVTAPEAGDALAEYGFITPAERQRVIDIAKPVLLPRNRNTPLNQRPLPDVPGMNREMARHLADMTLGYTLRHLDEVDMPASAREWFATAALSPLQADWPARPKRLSTGNVALWSNRRDALELQGLAPRFESLAAADGAGRLAGGPLGSFLGDVLGQNAGQAYEQGWCLTRMGRDFLPEMEQRMWNLFLYPARSWERMDEASREELRAALGEFCRREPAPEAMDIEAAGGAPDYVETALANLDAVLRDYPELHAYELERGNDPRVRRLELELPGGEGFPPPPEASPLPPYSPHVGGPGFRLTAWEPAPGFVREDSRVLPALTLLGTLRSYATQRPFAWDGGIQWKGEQYGNVAGKRPHGVAAEWKVDAPLRHFLDMLGQLDALAPEGGQLTQCGVKLAGFTPGMDLSPLTNITIYRDPRNPSHIVRLMPGERNAANERVRVPYVVHSAAGAYMNRTRTLPDSSEMAASYVPLHSFYYDMPHISKGESIAPRAARHIEHTLNAVLSSSRRMSGFASPDSGIVSMRELLLRFVEDTGFSSALKGNEPHELSYGQSLTLSLARSMLDCVCGPDQQAAYRRYVRLCHRIRRSGRARGEVLRTLLESAQELFDMGDPLREKYYRKSRESYERVYRGNRPGPLMNHENLRALRDWSRRNPID